MRISLLFCCMALLTGQGVLARSVEIEWAKRFGGTSVDLATKIAVDGSGNVYVTGRFMGTGVPFNTSGASSVSTELNSKGQGDVYVAKYNPSGSLLWVRGVGGASDEEGRTIGVDKDDNVYVAGAFMGTLETGVGSIPNLTATGSRDLFVAKWNAGGILLWAKKAGGSGLDELRGMTVNRDNGNIYLTGSVSNTDAVFGSFTLASAGSNDIFVAGMNTGGDFLWAKRFGGAGADAGYGIALDHSGNLLLTGLFNGTLDLGGGAQTQVTSSGLSDIFVAKGSAADGSFSWARRLGGAKADEPRAVTSDAQGNIYTTGFFTESGNFNPSGTYTLTGVAGQNDIFISKLDPSGNFVYAAAIGDKVKAPAGEVTVWGFVGETLAVEPGTGNLLIGGKFESAPDFAPGTDMFYRRTVGQQDGFILSLTPAGSLSWVRTFGGRGASDECLGLAVDEAAGVIYAAGRVQSLASGPVNFDPAGTSAESLLITTAGNSVDPFLLKLKPSGCMPSISLLQPLSACDSFIAEGTKYVEDDTVSVLFADAAGCDSMVTYELKIVHSSFPVILPGPVQSCDSFVFFGEVYTQSGTYTQMLNNAAGCDSMITFELEIVQSPSHTIQAAMDCHGFMVDTITFYEPGLHTLYFSHSSGCDSVVYVELTLEEADMSVSIADGILTSNASGAEWQWLDCDDSFAAVPEARSQSFAPARPGRYAVEVTWNGCVDTSECYSSVPESVAYGAAAGALKLYPVPVYGLLHIESPQAGSLMVYNVQGQLLHRSGLRSGVQAIDVSGWAGGIYLLDVRYNDGSRSQVHKFLKAE